MNRTVGELREWLSNFSPDKEIFLMDNSIKIYKGDGNAVVVGEFCSRKDYYLMNPGADV